ncbi:hypothetical protein [Bradyrhizobium canariense]|uniref:hypothetical protein n=1 Tax=Bradyrhizobium canariense TaxID=255045 RepID=UPI001F0A5AC5|nr:hypothetical protein [Bradyrhizobium canariense]
MAEAATAGFRGSLIARGQARAIIWRDGALPPDAPAFAPQLSYDLHSYGYALLGLGLRLLELGGDATQARTAFEQSRDRARVGDRQGQSRRKAHSDLFLGHLVSNATKRFLSPNGEECGR